MKIKGCRVFTGLILFLMISCISATASPITNPINENSPSNLIHSISVRDFLSLDNISDRFGSDVMNVSSRKISADPLIIPRKTIYNHFLTIAFSDMNYKLQRQEPRNRPIIVSLYGSFTREDAVVIEQFIRDFNHVSTSMKFYPYVKTNADTADFWINMFPEKDLHSLSTDQAGNLQVDYTQYDGSILSNTILYHTDTKAQVFVNDDLPADQRRHYMLRAVTYCLGLTGDATDTSSFFYPGNTEQINLTETDWRAIRILYGPIMERNLTVYEVMSRLYA